VEQEAHMEAAMIPQLFTHLYAALDLAERIDDKTVVFMVSQAIGSCKVRWPDQNPRVVRAI
jgi:hypothetical protein